MHIFYKPEVHEKEFYLSEEESKHCVKVLRLKEQDVVYLVDGVGGFYHAQIVEANLKKCKVAVYQHFKEYGKRNYHLTVAIAPTKNNERFEWFLEKATEIGVDRIIPIACQQSERKIIKQERLNKIIVEAIKQSQQAYLPELMEISDFKSIVNRTFEGKKLIAYCTDENRQNLKAVVNPGEDVMIMIGPEGDFTAEEISMALNKGYSGVSLGNNRLRTETAGVFACNSIALINQ